MDLARGRVSIAEGAGEGARIHVALVLYADRHHARQNRGDEIDPANQLHSLELRLQ